MRMKSNLRALLLLGLCCLNLCSGQRFLRQGMSSQLDSDIQNELKLDDTDSMFGMSREMFLMEKLDWQLQPPDLDYLANGPLKRHINKYLSSPLEMRLLKRKGKHGLRAVGRMQDGKKLRAFWRQSPVGGPALKKSDFLVASYDDAVRSRLTTIEFEVQLPPLSKSNRALPSIVYEIAVESGTMNPKSVVPRGAGEVRVYPDGRKEGATPVRAGSCNVGAGAMRPGVIDPSWAKGRPVFRKGRPAGVI